MADDKAGLRKIAEIKIGEQTYDLARNGAFALVEPTEDDAYGRPVARVVRLDGFVSVERFQAVLNLLGDAIVRQQSVDDLRRARIGEAKGEGV